MKFFNLNIYLIQGLKAIDDLRESNYELKKAMHIDKLKSSNPIFGLIEFNFNTVIQKPRIKRSVYIHSGNNKRARAAFA